MVRKLGSSYKYLQKLAGQFAVPGRNMATRMVSLYPELTLEELFKLPKKVPAKPGPPKKAPAKKAAKKATKRVK